MAGLHNQVTNRPTLVVHDKINDVADRSFASLDGVAAKSLCALQMNIVACLLTRNKMRRWWSLGKTAHAPRFDSVPVCLILSRDRLVRLNRGTVFKYVAESDSQAGSRRPDAGFRKHGEKSAPSGPIAMNLCPRQHSGQPI